MEIKLLDAILKDKKMIVKAEILWTRKCLLDCHYCKMHTGLANTRYSDFWKRGLQNLQKLNCKFIAIYGAEPLCDFDKLPRFVADAAALDIKMTVITSGIVPNWKYKLRILYDAGLRSVTVSHDMKPLDKSSATKSDNALEVLSFFKTLGPTENTGAVATLTRTNFQEFPAMLKQMNKLQIWTFFDIIHPDRKQPGGKTRGSDYDLLFRKEDIPDLITMLKTIQKMKAEGYRTHASQSFLNYLIKNNDVLIKFNWNCANATCFPSWVTVNCDGLVYPCDDFQPEGIGIPFDQLVELLPLKQKLWKKTTHDLCSGCCWNTHLDAHFIAQGKERLDGDIHTR